MTTTPKSTPEASPKPSQETVQQTQSTKPKSPEKATQNNTTPKKKANPQNKANPPSNTKLCVAINSLNTIVAPPKLYFQAVIPTTETLLAPAWPDLKGVPDDEGVLKAHNSALQSDLDTKQQALRSGYVYVFREGTLYAEYTVENDPEYDNSLYQKIDLKTEQGKDIREALCPETAKPYLILPVDGKQEIAFSEDQWPWALIQQPGGLKPKAALDPFDGHAAMVDALPVMAAKDDDHLVDWSPSRAAQMRATRCQTIPTDRAPDQGKFCPLETPTCQPDTVIPNQIQQSMPAICGFSDEPLPAMREVIQFLVVPVKDPLGLAASFAERLAQAWGLLSDVMHNMKTYPNKELPGAFPFAQYYDSALIAYRLFFAREAQPVAGETRWQKDALNKDAFEHLSLTDLEAALAISLRRTLYTTISFWQNAFVDFINGKDKWADWPENLKITLDDYWAMPVYRGPFNELDLSQAGEDSQVQFKNYAHRRWEHLYNILGLTLQPPQDYARLIEHDSVGIALADEANMAAPKKLLDKILSGDHYLSELVFNAPKTAIYTCMSPLVELAELSLSLHGRALTESDREEIHAQEKELLEKLIEFGDYPVNHYVPEAMISDVPDDADDKSKTQATQSKDGTTEDQKEAEKSESDSDGTMQGPSAALDRNMKLSLLSIKLASTLIHTLSPGVFSLETPGLDPTRVNPRMERLRNLFNSATGSQLRYVGFDQIVESAKNPYTKHTLISHFLHEVKDQRVSVITESTPEAQAHQTKQQLEQQQAKRRQEYLSDRKEIKRKILNQKIPELRKNLNAELNEIRQQTRMAKRNINDIDAKLKSLKIQGKTNSSAYSRLLLDRAEYEKRSAKQHADRARINNELAALKEHETWIREDFKADKAAFRSGGKNKIKAKNNADTKKKNSILADAPALEKFYSTHPLLPLSELYDADKAFQDEIKQGTAKQQAAAKKYAQDYNEKLNKPENKHKHIVNTSTPEGRELEAFWATQHEKLGTQIDVEVIPSDNPEHFRELREKYANDTKRIVLSDTQSTIWREQHKGLYLVIDDAPRLSTIAPEMPVRSQTFRNYSLVLGLIPFDIWNTYCSIATLNSGKPDAVSVRNLTDLAFNTMGSIASTAEAWQVIYQYRTSSSHTVAKAIAKRAGIATAALGLALAIMDIVKYTKQGDDAALAHYAYGASALALAGQMLSGSLSLGFVSLILAGIGLFMQFFLFRVDDLLEIWLEYGPFSEIKPLFDVRIRKPLHNSIPPVLMDGKSFYVDRKPYIELPHLKTWQVSESLFDGYFTGIENTLKDAKGNITEPLYVSVAFSFTRLVMDQNYKVLGIAYQGLPLGRIPSNDKVLFWIEPNDQTVYLKHNEQKVAVGEIGKVIAGTSAAIRKLLHEKVETVSGTGYNSDVSNRFGKSATGDEDKYTDAMANSVYGGAASLEILLNGMFPLTTDLKLIPLNKHGDEVQTRKDWRGNTSHDYYPIEKN